MDCKTARLFLEYDRPLGNELPGPDAEALRSHLADCPSCGPLAQAERQFDDAVGRAMRDVPIPEGLRDRLLKRLDAERDGWYRSWALRSAGIAAAVALLIWAGLAWRDHQRPTVDPQRILTEAFHQSGGTPETVEAWFRERGVDMVAPDGLDYHYLAFYNLADFEGRPAPELVFVRGSAYARVIVVNDSQFDLEALRSSWPPRENSGGFTVEVIPYPTTGQPRYAFVVICKGAGLSWFRGEEARPST